MDIFKRYDSPEQYAEAFQQMIDARERWREQIRVLKCHTDLADLTDIWPLAMDTSVSSATQVPAPVNQ